MTIKYPRFFIWGRGYNPESGYYRLESENKGTFVSAKGEKKGPGLAFCLERVRLGDLSESTKAHIARWIGQSPEWQLSIPPAT